METTRFHRSTLVEDLVQELRRMILAREIAPGDFLPSRKELAARFGVGLSTVHEAIQALAAVGLVASRPGKGTWVRPDALDTLVHPDAIKTRLGEIDVRCICEARSVIEVALTELAAERATEGQIEQIWNALRAMEAALDDDVAFTVADLDFHLAVAKAGQNELLEQFYHLSRKLLSKVIRGLISFSGVKAESIEIQRTIALAIKERRPERARAAALEHMRYIEELLDRNEH
jgi:GntR family transcriptional repressor for pyruvate dehydrogenase complex